MLDFVTIVGLRRSGKSPLINGALEASGIFGEEVGRELRGVQVSNEGLRCAIQYIASLP